MNWWGPNFHSWQLEEACLSQGQRSERATQMLGVTPLGPFRALQSPVLYASFIHTSRVLLVH